MPNSAPQMPAKWPRGTRYIVIGCILIVIASLVMGVMLTPRNDEETPASAQQSKSSESFQPTPEQWVGLKITPVSEMAFRSQQATDGKIANNDDTTTPVFSPYSGRVTRLIAKPGDVVKQGDPLFTVEASELAQAQNDIVSSAAAVTAAKAQLKNAEMTAKRQSALYEAQGTALKNLQQSQADLATAQETLRTNQIAYAAAHNHLRILGKSDADIASIENAPEAQKLDAETVVVAPIDGTVIQRQIGLGQFIQSGAANPVYTIGNLSTLWLIANVREEDAPLMRVDAPVEVRILAIPGRIFKAKLSYVAASIDPVTHRLPVRAEVENTDGVLKPEMFASFSISTGSDMQSLAIPDSAVVYEGDKAHIWLVRDDKNIALKNVQVGRIADGMAEITDGLKKDDKVVTSGALFIDRAAAGE